MFTAAQPDVRSGREIFWIESVDGRQPGFHAGNKLADLGLSPTFADIFSCSSRCVPTNVPMNASPQQNTSV